MLFAILVPAAASGTPAAQQGGTLMYQLLVLVVAQFLIK
jgi:hypothetical protein